MFAFFSSLNKIQKDQETPSSTLIITKKFMEAERFVAESKSVGDFKKAMV